MIKKQADNHFNQLCKGCRSVVAGLFLLMVAIMVLFRNEGTVVQRYKMIEELKGGVVSVGSEKTSILNEHLLLHVVGDLFAEEPVIDEEYGIIADDAVKIKRVVSMYQRHENLDESIKNQKSYYYTKQRSPIPVDSTRFHEPGYDNPPFPKAVAAKEIVADPIFLGKFELDRKLVDDIQDYEMLALEPSSLLAASGTSDRLVQEDVIIKKHDANQSGFQVGDVSIAFQKIVSDTYTVMGQQKEQKLVPYDTYDRGKIFFVKKGEVAPSRMFAEIAKLHILRIRGIRILGVFIVIFATLMILKPSQVIMGSYIDEEKKVRKIQLAIAGSISLGIVLMLYALARLFVKPWLSATLFALSLAVILTLSHRQNRIHIIDKL